MRAVRFDEYGDVEVLHLAEVAEPTPSPGRVVVRVRTAGVSTGEAKIRTGEMDGIAPARFPEGQGTEFSGILHALGPDTDGLGEGDPVIGFADGRSAQADYVDVPAENLIMKPASIDWDTAAALISPGATATAVLQAVPVGPGDLLVVAGASGGVGLVVTQLAVARGARVIATGSEPNHDFLRGIGADPVSYGDGLAERIRILAPSGVDAYADCHGDGNVDVALTLGVPADRINTIADFAAADRTGARTNGMYQLDDIRAALAPIVDGVAAGDIVVPVKERYPLARVQDAYRRLTQPGGVGRVVLEVSSDQDGSTGVR